MENNFNNFKYQEKTPEEALKKWSPILDVLKVTVKRQLIAEYAERHSHMEFERVTTFSTPETTPLDIITNPDLGQNLLPVSLKILSQLNLNGKNVSLKDGLPTISFSVELEKNEVKDIKEVEGLELVQKLENKLVDNLVTYINKELETKDNLYINTVCQSISIISTEEWSPRMEITSRIYID